MAVYQSINVLADTPPSQASQLPQGGMQLRAPALLLLLLLFCF
jgi:hypothetical protein